MRRVLIWGTGGHARVVVDALRLQSELEIAGFIDDTRVAESGISLMGHQLLGGRDQLIAAHANGVTSLLVAIGNCQIRQTLCDFGKTHGFDIVGVRHPAAIVSNESFVDADVQVLAGAVIAPGACVSMGTIINHRAVVDHDCKIGAYAHVAPGAVLCGGVIVGAGTWVGAASVVRQGLRIGNQALIGAGSVVVTDISDRSVAYGNPAIVHRHQEQS